MDMKRPMAGLVALSMLTSMAGCVAPHDHSHGYDDRRGYNEPPPPPAGPGYDGRDAAAPPPGYDPARDYREERGDGRSLSRDDRVYRGDDGRYYCKRSDGTTGLVVGAVAGAALGAILGGGGLLGTLLGAGGGGLLGHSVDKGEVRCR